jgi:Tol biopolymer transport system component
VKKKLLLLVATFGVAIGAASFNFGGDEASATVPYVSSLASVNSSGTQGNAESGDPSSQTSFSADGRYVLFSSSASNLVSGDTDGLADLFVRDRLNGTTTRVDVTSSGTQISGATSGDVWGKISADGKFVVFESEATNLPTGTVQSSTTHIYLHNMQTGTTTMVDIGVGGAMPNSSTYDHSVDISADGRYIVFTASSTNLVSNDNNGQPDVFVRDTKLGTTTLISKADNGTASNGVSIRPSISCDGSLVAFSSNATDLVANDTNGVYDTFLVNRVGGDTIKDITINANAASGVSIGWGRPLWTPISCDGSTLVIPSKATNLTSGVTSNTQYHLYAYDTFDETFELIDQKTNGTTSNGEAQDVSISWDGNLVAFQTSAGNLDSSGAGDSNFYSDVYLRNRKDGTTERVSKGTSGTELSPQGESTCPAISLDGRYVSFASAGANIVSGDTNGWRDVFVSQSGYTPTNY